MERTEIAVLVGAIISGMVSVATLFLRLRERRVTRTIERAPPEDLLRIVASEGIMFPVPVESLTKQQVYELALRQLSDRDRQRVRTFAFSSIVLASLVALILVLGVKGSTLPSTGHAIDSGPSPSVKLAPQPIPLAKSGATTPITQTAPPERSHPPKRESPKKKKKATIVAETTDPRGIADEPTKATVSPVSAPPPQNVHHGSGDIVTGMKNVKITIEK